MELLRMQVSWLAGWAATNQVGQRLLNLSPPFKAVYWSLAYQFDGIIGREETKFDVDRIQA